MTMVTEVRVLLSLILGWNYEWNVVSVVLEMKWVACCVCRSRLCERKGALCIICAWGAELSDVKPSCSVGLVWTSFRREPLWTRVNDGELLAWFQSWIWHLPLSLLQPTQWVTVIEDRLCERLTSCCVHAPWWHKHLLLPWWHRHLLPW